MLLAERLSDEKKYTYKTKKSNINLTVTNHFFKRWNERVKNPKFKYKKDLTEFLESMLFKREIHWIKNDHYIINDDIIIIAKVIKIEKNKNKVILVTTYGSTKNNPILYNMCLDGDIEENFKKYGKLNFDYTSQHA